MSATADAPQAGSPRMSASSLRRLVRDRPIIPLIVLLGVLVVVSELVRPGLVSTQWVGTIMRAAVPLAILAGCQTLTMLTGGIDLSVGAVASMTGFVLATLVGGPGLGVGILVNLFQLLATFYAAVAIFVVLVLLPVAMIARVPIRRFAQAVAEPVSIAFATTSSEAALPRAMEAMERFGVPRQIVAFVMPTGYSFNLDGSTLYLSLAAIFVAQAAGIDLSVGQQFVLLLTLMLSSKGVAGVPRGALVILLGTVTSFGLPAEPVFVILGIDAVLDMLRTSVNVLGNCLATVVIARWEGEFPSRDAEQPAQAAGSSRALAVENSRRS